MTYTGRSPPVTKTLTTSPPPTYAMMAPAGRHHSSHHVTTLTSSPRHHAHHVTLTCIIMNTTQLRAVIPNFALPNGDGMAKKRLYNKVNKEELKQKMQESSEERTTLSFYKYFNIDDPIAYRDQMYMVYDQMGVMGRIYVATEGVNAQISLPSANLELFVKSIPEFRLDGIRLNYAIEDDGKSFYALKIKVRKKIVADGLDDREIDLEKRGTPLSAKAYNELTDREDVTIVDMRNHYESEVGHFENAVQPDVVTFRESLPIIRDLLSEKKDQPLVMYCTGGIRCEKASAYMVQNGFEQVYMVDGGIIEYKRQVEEQGLRNKFHGKNFVFDERLGERISGEVISNCHQCGEPADTHVNCANDACHILFIQCPNCAEKYAGCCSAKCADFIKLPLEEQKVRRKTEVFNGTKFSKGRYKAFKKAGEVTAGSILNQD